MAYLDKGHVVHDDFGCSIVMGHLNLHETIYKCQV